MDDTNRADHIYGEVTSIIQGKMSKMKPTARSNWENTFTYSNNRETKKHTSLHGFLKPYMVWYYYTLWYKNLFPLGKITDTKKRKIIHQRTWGYKNRIFYKRF